MTMTSTTVLGARQAFASWPQRERRRAQQLRTVPVQVRSGGSLGGALSIIGRLCVSRDK